MFLVNDLYSKNVTKKNLLVRGKGEGLGKQYSRMAIAPIRSPILRLRRVEIKHS